MPEIFKMKFQYQQLKFICTLQIFKTETKTKTWKTSQRLLTMK
jgi:hypothetical protein